MRSLEVRMKISEGSKRSWKDPTIMLKHVLASKRMWQNREYRDNQSRVQTLVSLRKWEDKDFREMMSDKARLAFAKGERENAP